jgi:hypothetical protein
MLLIALGLSFRLDLDASVARADAVEMEMAPEPVAV